jgi:hypothetical protein
MVYAARVLERPSEHTIIAYMLTASTLRGNEVGTALSEVLVLIQSKGFVVRLIGCDGAPTNIAAIKTLCRLGRGDISCENGGEDEHYFEPKMPNPLYPEDDIWFIVCSDHCMKRLVRAAFESHGQRKRSFEMPTATHSQPFTWEAIYRVWMWDKAHHKCRRTKLLAEDVFRDGFSDLRVKVALMAIDEHVLASILAIAQDLQATGKASDNAVAKDMLQMHEYLSQLAHAFRGLFLSTDRGVRIRSVPDLQVARDLYLWLR